MRRRRTPARARATTAGREWRASVSRCRQASHRHIGTTTNPCVNVSERIQIATIEAAVGQYSARMPSTARPAASTGASRQLARHRGVSIARSSCLASAGLPAGAARGPTRARFAAFASRVRAPSDQPAYPLCGVSHVYPRLRVSIGPSALTSGRGSRCQSATSVRYFGLSGLFCGIAAHLAQPVLVVQRLRLESPVLLEIERTGAALAAAVVEDAHTALACRGASAPST